MLTIILFAANLIINYFIFQILESCYKFRIDTALYPGGAYYSKVSLAEYVAMKYLVKLYQIRIDALPQGGYNIYPIKFPSELEHILKIVKDLKNEEKRN